SFSRTGRYLDLSPRIPLHRSRTGHGLRAGVMAWHTVVQNRRGVHEPLPAPHQLRFKGIDLLSMLSRIVWLFLLTWPPLLALTTASGVARGTVSLPLLYDFVVAVRFLIAVPLVVYADALIRARAADLFHYLVASGIVAEEQAASFEDLSRRFARLRDSNAA